MQQRVNLSYPGYLLLILFTSIHQTDKISRVFACVCLCSHCFARMSLCSHVFLLACVFVCMRFCANVPLLACACFARMCLCSHCHVSWLARIFVRMSFLRIYAYISDSSQRLELQRTSHANVHDWRPHRNSWNSRIVDTEQFLIGNQHQLTRLV